jgi:hypothetical protein
VDTTRGGQILILPGFTLSMSVHPAVPTTDLCLKRLEAELLFSKLITYHPYKIMQAD